MKKKILLILMAMTMSLTACSNSGSSKAVAVVNGDEISRESFNEEFDLYKKMLYGDISDEDLSQDAGNGKSIRSNLASQVVDTMIMDKLIEDEFEKQGLKLEDAELEEAMTNVVDQSGGEEAFNSQLEAMGIAREDMEKIVSRTLKSDKLRQNYVANNQKSDQEVQEYFEQNKDSIVSYEVSHILVETEEEAKEIIEDLEGGADFAQLAEERSTDQGSAAIGGDLGEITMQTNFVQPFLDAVREMEEGAISDPVESEHGYHIIKLGKVYDNLEDHKEDIQSMLLEPEVNAYMQGLYETAEISTYKPSMEEAEDTDAVSEGEADQVDPAESGQDDEADQTEAGQEGEGQEKESSEGE